MNAAHAFLEEEGPATIPNQSGTTSGRFTVNERYQSAKQQGGYTGLPEDFEGTRCCMNINEVYRLFGSMDRLGEEGEDDQSDPGRTLSHEHF